MLQVVDKFYNLYTPEWNEFLEQYFLFRDAVTKVYLKPSNDKKFPYREFIGTDGMTYREWPPADARAVAESYDFGGSDF